MESVWPFAMAAAAVVAAVVVVLGVVRYVRRTDAQAAVRMPDLVVALLALGATVFFGVQAEQSADKPSTGSPESPGSATPRSPSGSATSAGGQADARDVVRILQLADRPGVVDATVRVSGPPSEGTEYLLVVHHNTGYQLKGRVPPETGEHRVEADLRLADPGSWRRFYVVGADPDGVRAWEGSLAGSLSVLPAGSRALTGAFAHQMPN
ncbi:hypothetical protein O7635_29225 [Asanoa sp. WMMD1127]|uniref:hypothetical protein n=1 Tax=Asanoa sp. WMMD1127 TaxID=3016107 RepID=UPI002416C6E3|nr:hypothetical protein [Asanoa sp. WMMD1127]MDG4825950.1 hypothetical protein [Asanoa sp. WMMD1127]